MKPKKKRRSPTAAAADQGPLEHLLAVADGKPFINLSWRLLMLLVDGVDVERRELGPENVLTVDASTMDTIYLEREKLQLDGKIFEPPADAPRDLRDRLAANKARWLSSSIISAGAVAVPIPTTTPEEPTPKYRGTLPLRDKSTYKVNVESVVHIFRKPSSTPPRKRRRGTPVSGELRSRWEWLCNESVVARGALKSPTNDQPRAEQHQTVLRGEVVLLTSQDVVEYLPAFTDLLAQAMALGDRFEESRLRVRLLRLDPRPHEKGWERQPKIRWIGREHEHSIEVFTAYDGAGLLAALAEPTVRDHCHYLFVDPYDRATDHAAVQVKSLTTRSRVIDVAGKPILHEVPGSTLTAEQLGYLVGSARTQRGYGKDYGRDVDTIVHVARNFRIDTTLDDPDKLHFHAVVLDSRTARFESGGSRDPAQNRNADDPLPSRVDPPEPFDDAPTTRLHLNLLRLKKAWEQSPDIHDVCQVLDEPNVPRTGEQSGYWKAGGFFERWVRDLRFRRVGVALGGGGATGFCHVALLRKLRDENIPIDLVSGTSFGALVGAYYCSRGLDGLEMLAEQALLLTGLASLTILSSAFLEQLVNLSIEYRPMWELPIPLYAVATDIEAGEAAVFPGPTAANPSVGFAVRASGSLPGIFSPALAGDRRYVRYVDGGAVSIVPAKPLLRFGADVVIGSNAFPFRKNDATYQPTPLRAFLPPPFGRFAERFLAEINPGNRLTDAARSLSLSLSDDMYAETQIASALYEHKRTDVKYWEFHRARLVLRAAVQDLVTADALPAAINAVRLLNQPVP